MAIGERIRFFRNLKGMTQKYLGMQVGFQEKTADIRMAQYESGSRTPKTDLTNDLANVFGVSTSALTVPDIDTYQQAQDFEEKKLFRSTLLFEYAKNCF